MASSGARVASACPWGALARPFRPVPLVSSHSLRVSTPVDGHDRTICPRSEPRIGPATASGARRRPLPATARGQPTALDSSLGITQQDYGSRGSPHVRIDPPRSAHDERCGQQVQPQPIAFERRNDGTTGPGIHPVTGSKRSLIMARRSPSRMRQRAHQQWALNRLWGEQFRGCVWRATASLPAWTR